MSVGRRGLAGKSRFGGRFGENTKLLYGQHTS